jgi:phosphatidylserine/phosphatidylglycerophosphate/cardiolipin synthase-like enzyme
MKIIDNLNSDNNHKEYILSMIKISDELLITSPYLMRDFSLFFKDKTLSNIKTINLITTLQPKSLDQLKKVYSLKSLIEIPKIKSGEIKCNISLNNKLHGKIYIFKKTGKYVGGLISSANFTDSGLWLNHEWGITLNDEKNIKKLEYSITSSIEPKFKNLSHKSILRLLKKLNSFINQNGKKKNDEIDLDLTLFLETEESEKGENNSNKTYEYQITEKYLETWKEYFEEFVIFKKENKDINSFEKQIQAYLSMKFQYPNLKPPIGTFKTEREVLAQWKFHFNKLPDWKQKD